MNIQTTSQFGTAFVGLVFGLLLAVAPMSQAAEAPPRETGTVADPAGFWGSARDAQSGYTTDKGPEAGVLITQSGEDWRTRRNGYVKEFGKWALGIVIIAIAAVYFAKGTVRLEHGRSGRMVERWTPFNRFLHWYVAVLFVVLAVSGLIILYGKYLLIPLIGKGGFGAVAIASKVIHNYSGPLFGIGLIVMALLWFRHNIPKAIDLKWFLAGGGILTKDHPSAEFLNGGEKVWFWITVIGGGLVLATGLVLNFPNFEQVRETMQDANVLHAITALVLVAVFLGHVYIATIGTEGALEGMVHGKVDVEWAKQHHDLWYKEVAGGDKPT